MIEFALAFAIIVGAVCLGVGFIMWMVDKVSRL